MLTKTTTRPSVWIGCLACYNSGSVVGEWVPAEEAGDITPADLHENPTTHEELWCFDIEGFPTGTNEMSVHTAVLWGELFQEVGEALWEPLLKWAENGGHVEDANGLPDSPPFEDRYRGCWPSFRDFLTEEVELMQADWSDEAVRYFDWDSYERDARFDFTVIDAPHGEVYVFADL